MHAHPCYDPMVFCIWLRHAMAESEFLTLEMGTCQLKEKTGWGEGGKPNRGTKKNQCSWSAWGWHK
jgi:hypothetical protein